jgi:nitroreductase
MEFSDVVICRKSVRGYLDKPVEEEKLVKILEAARLAPSWANKQCCQYLVIKDKELILRIGSIYNSWLKQAPVIVMACADPFESGAHDGMDYYLVDVGISMQQLILAATDLGLGTCWIGSFGESKVKELLKIPKNVKVVAMTPIGYSSDEGVGVKVVKEFIGSNRRKSVEEFVHWNKW